MKADELHKGRGQKNRKLSSNLIVSLTIAYLAMCDANLTMSQSQLHNPGLTATEQQSPESI